MMIIAMDEMKQVILQFIERINAHDVDGIVALMSKDYEFVNSSGDHFRDLQFLKDTWRAQFQNHPDFKIRVDRVICDGECVGIFGFSEGTYSPDGVLREENHWEVPAAFLGIVRDGKVAYWETYSDASIVFDLIKSQSAAEGKG
jgi:ketosteroid isomerase-like protein